MYTLVPGTSAAQYRYALTLRGAMYCYARVVYTNQNFRKSGIRQAQLNLAHPLHTNYMEATRVTRSQNFYTAASPGVRIEILCSGRLRPAPV